MAFAALHPEAGRIDATLEDLGCGLAWSAVYRVRPRVALRCPECGYGVHAKVSAKKLRHFAHDPGRPADCAWLNESLEHHLLKLELATAIRTAGWHAELEVRAPDGTWRADVLASSQDGTRRVAWEAQLSPITDEDLQARTDRYESAGIGVCWVSPAERVPWLGVVPSIQVADPGEGRTWTVADGAAGFDIDQGAWVRVSNLDLTAFVGWVLRRHTAAYRIRPRYRWVHLGGGRQSLRRVVWTTGPHITAELRHEAKRQHQEVWRRQRQREEAKAEQRRQREEEARRQEEQRRREREAEAARIRFEEQQRQLAIEVEQQRQRWEAEQRLRAEEARAAEEMRLRRERIEHRLALKWWDEVPPEQIQQLLDAVVDRLWREQAVRVAVDRDLLPDFAFGMAVYTRHQLSGIVRPCPTSLHRLPRGGLVFARNAREARQIRDATRIEAPRLVHFDLPDHQQMTLL